jgi:hypothetical protein
MRQIYIIPIIHSRHDLGSLEQSIRDAKSQFASSSAMESNQRVVDFFWNELQYGIESWRLDYSNTYVFQDALPFTGHPERILEHRIVDELATKGSANHKLVQWLVEQGATLEGTESTELLLREYDLVRKSLAEGGHRYDEPAKSSSTGEVVETLLNQRDRFIAGRIAETVNDDQIGILFIGMQHRVQDYLQPDFQVSYPFGKMKVHVTASLQDAV